MSEELNAHVRDWNDWRSAFNHDMDGMRDAIASMKDAQRDTLAIVQAERELAREQWDEIARHDSMIRVILRRYRRRNKR